MKGVEPVRAWRIDRATAKAAASVAAAREDAAGRRAAAEAEAQKLAAAACSEGEAAADSDTVRDWTAARRRARAIVLSARKQAYDELVAAATTALLADARYPGLARRVTDIARRELGPGAEVDSRAGVVVATRRARSVRWSAGEAVERVVISGRVDVEALWS